MREIVRNRRVKPENLESVKRERHLIKLLSMQKNFYKFLECIKRTIGASLVVTDEGQTGIALHGKIIQGYTSNRFSDKDNLQALINFAGLN
ncbi:hypothetical protein LCGC14_1064270 [marine sediment metagenome]|uniref:Uncharacterized protein n=2 Tax=root TaxID=1 RepID=A0A831VWT7_9FLAO|nr:hypothetical protein [Pricia sp.]HEA22759.1 hypothetical protein [Pricia antarctica]